jgi:hypothetical protein
VLLIPARFTDWRMWSGIPAQLARRAAVSHLDQLISLPWAAAPDAVVGQARSRAPHGWDVLVATVPPSTAAARGQAAAAIERLTDRVGRQG